ncbi:MAG: PocR ligand-binding domain-containing protein [Kiritimatiellae bacterium]|nr:PocR ligand-binding domain-containing protein [Kiritimatiellia bacterium]
MLTYRQLAALPEFHEFYQLIRRLFGIDIAIVAADGKSGSLLGRKGGLNHFCQALQQRAAGMDRCVACDAENVRRASQSGAPVRYTCHAGLTEFVIPVMVEHACVACLQCGQVLGRTPKTADWSATRRQLAWCGGNMQNLRRAFLRSPVISPRRQLDLIALLRLFANHVALAHARLLLSELQPPDQVVSKALTFMKNGFRDDIGLEDVAQAAGASKRNLTRIVRARTGATVLNHLQRLRIAYACDQLRLTDAKITQVALNCGYGSVQQFNRGFRQRMHDTPRRWRARQRR